MGLCDRGLLSSNWELLNLILPSTQFEQEIVWLISNFVRYVWTTCYVGDSDVKLDKFFGFMTFKYKMDKNTCGITLGQIAGLG